MNWKYYTKDIAELLREKGLTISVSESLTGGMIQDAFTSASGVSDVFAGGITVYNIDQKVKHLGVDREEAEKVNCVSQEVAHQMAKGCSNLFETNIGFGITGYAEDYEGNNPHCYYSIVNNGKIVSYGRIDGEEPLWTGFFHITKSRNQNRIHFTRIVLNMILGHLKTLKFG